MKVFIGSFLVKFKQLFATVSRGRRLSTSDWLFRFSLEEQILFTKRLSILLRAGMPMPEALVVLQSQVTKPYTLVLLADIIDGVRQGQLLHVRMASFRKYFGDFAISIVRVGEMSGTLSSSLSYLAGELKKKRDLRYKLLGALLYPAIVLFATIGIALLLIVYVFPKILPILQGFRGALPVSTRVLIFISNVFITRGWLIVGVVVLLIITVTLLVKRLESVRHLVHTLLLRLPVFGNLLKSYYMAHLFRTFGVLLRSEVPIVESVRTVSETSPHLVYRDSMARLSEQIMRGGTVSAFLMQEKHLYPAMVGQMAYVGEMTGSLSETLLYVAEVYEQEVEELTRNLSVSLEPILMVFLGLLVGFMAMSIITPIYSLTQSLGR